MRSVVVGLGLLLLTVPAAAQEEGRRLGIGIGMGSSTFFSGGSWSQGPTIHFPAVLGQHVLAEPFVAVARRSRTVGQSGGENELKILNLSIGLGGFWLQEAGKAGRVYLGPRVGILRDWAQQGNDAGTEMTRLAWTLSGVVGGEFFIVERFSLGAEVGLEYLDVGDPEYDPEPDHRLHEEESQIRTLSQFRIRWYFR